VLAYSRKTNITDCLDITGCHYYLTASFC